MIAPKLPDFPVPADDTEMSWLRTPGRAQGTRTATARPTPSGFPARTGRSSHELDVIEHLGFAGYFLIVHDIVQFCEDDGIVCQGRGSAANSAVCYALGITSVDPVQHGLLFERFLSTGRDGPPDIDLDIEHQRREEVIQYVYDTYGRRQGRAGRERDRVPAADGDQGRGPGARLLAGAAEPVVQAGRAAHRTRPDSRFRPTPAFRSRSSRWPSGCRRCPRHLGIHSGGMVICDRPVGRGLPGRVGADAEPLGAAVGQGRLRVRGAGQVRPARARHADRAAGLLRAGGRAPRRPLGPALDPAGGRRGLRHAVRGRHRRGVPGRVAGPDGDAAAAAAEGVLRPGGRGRADQARPDPGRLGAPVHAPPPRRRAAVPAAPVDAARRSARRSGCRCSRSR